VTAKGSETQPEASRAEAETHGDWVRVGVARAELLNRLLRDARVIAAFADLPEIAPEPGPEEIDGAAITRLIIAAIIERSCRLTALTRELGLVGLGLWLPEFLEAAAKFRDELANEDLRSSTIADPHLMRARACLHSWYVQPRDGSAKVNTSPTGLLSAAIPAAVPSDWSSRTPDWIELFALLVEHAAERPDWTLQATGTERTWPFLLWGDFVLDAKPTDDPRVLHGLVSLWANTCHGIIEAHTRPRPPAGQIPGESVYDAEGNLLSEGGRDKIRRWVGWYVDREVRRVTLGHILGAAFPDCQDRRQRSSEVKRHIRQARELLEVELPLDAGQPLRLWRLAQEHRSLLEQLLKISQEHGLFPLDPPPWG